MQYGEMPNDGRVYYFERESSHQRGCVLLTVVAQNFGVDREGCVPALLLRGQQYRRRKEKEEEEEEMKVYIFGELICLSNLASCDRHTLDRSAQILGDGDFSLNADI